MADDIKVYERGDDGEPMLWYDRDTNTFNDGGGAIPVASEEDADVLAAEWNERANA